MKNPNSILITGASSGLGAALAAAYAAPGRRLALTGRDADRLRAVVDACIAAGADASGHGVDVADRAAMEALYETIGTPDLVIANAGVSAGTSGATDRAEIDRRVLRTNLDGVVNTIYPAIARMKSRPRQGKGPRGQIAIIASLATFNGYPGAAAYGASKAAVRSLGEALRAERHGDGIEINVVCPGFVRSRITDRNKFRMPFFMEADKAARIILRGLAKDRARIAFPWPLYTATRLMGALPTSFRGWLVRRLGV